jgi:hypothetical protein
MSDRKGNDRKGREGYHDPFAGIAGAAPARSALTLRIVLATFGLLVCAAGAVVLWADDIPVAFPIIAARFALVALVDLVVVIRRKLHGEPG